MPLSTGPHTGWAALTATERQIVQFVCQGLTNPQIAARLHISRRTVSTHLYRVFKKVGVSSRTELATKATQREREVRR